MRDRHLHRNPLFLLLSRKFKIANACAVTKVLGRTGMILVYSLVPRPSSCLRGLGANRNKGSRGGVTQVRVEFMVG